MMTEAIIQFAASALVVVIAGYYLTKCADAISERTGLGGAIVGGIFLAAATSLPELLVDISAIRSGMPDLAVGDLFGSSLFNLLILAIADLLHRNGGSMFSRTAGGHALAGSMSINVTAIAGVAIMLGPQFKSTVFGVGPGVLTIFIAYIFGLRLIYANQKFLQKQVKTSEIRSEVWSLKKALVGYMICAGALIFAAPFVADSAGKIAELSGLGKTFVGTTLVAFCTSLPELVTSISAVRMGAYDLAIGNIFGSNAFNMLILLPLDAFHEGALLAAVSPVHALTALATIITTSVAVMGQLFQLESRKKFIEPDAFTIILLVFGFMVLLYFVKD